MDEPEVIVGIIGSGLSGIAAAYECEKQGMQYMIFEMDNKIGGTWSTQKFPGIRADSLHVQNLFSFHPVPSHSTTTGPWLQQYLEDVVQHYKLHEKISFNTKVLGIDWVSAVKRWKVATQDVNTLALKTIDVRFIINANGYFDLHRPNIPKQFQDIQFGGHIVHSARMTPADNKHLEGKKVVLVGSGATASTMVPELLKSVKSLTWVFRSASHCIPLFYLPWPISSFHTLLIHLYNRGITLPYRFYRFVFLSFIQGYMTAMCHYLPLGLVRAIYRVWNGSSYSDFTKFYNPDHEFGHQRICMVEGLYSLARNPKFKIIKGPVSSVIGNRMSVQDVNNDNLEVEIQEVDTILLCTGYDLSLFKFDLSIDGTKLKMSDQVLRREMFFENVPNFFFLCMFNRLSPTRTTSATPNLEVQAKMIVRLCNYTSASGHKAFMIKEFEDRSKVGQLVPGIANYIQRNLDKCFKGNQLECDATCALRYMFWERPLNPKEYIFE